MVFFGLLFAGFVVRHAHINEKGKNLDIQTPVGELKFDQNPSRASGLPVYPGATPLTNDGQANIEVRAGEKGVGVAVESYTTNDSLDKVTTWYSQRLGSTFKRENKDKNGDVKVHGLTVTVDSDVTFTDDHGDATKSVVLSTKDDNVQITLVRAGKRESQ